MLRNLNRSYSRGRICGTPHSGVLGNLIPSSGETGAAYTYNDLSLPADNDNEIRGEIVTWPLAGTLYAYEDTSFTFTAPDGNYTFEYQLYVDGVAVGSPETVNLAIGESGTSISCTIGNAVAAGNTATIMTGSNISCTAGNTIAAGSTATLYFGNTITCTVGNAVAAGASFGRTSCLIMMARRRRRK